MKENANSHYFNKALEPVSDSIRIYGAGLAPIAKSFERHKPILTYEVKRKLHDTFPNHPYLVELFMNMFFY